MKSALQIVQQIRKTPQYKYHIKIMANFSRYNTKYGYELSNRKIRKVLNLSKKQLDNIEAGSTKIPVKYYEAVNNYIKNQL